MCISDISSELSRCVTCVNVIEHVMIMIWEGEDVVHVHVYRMDTCFNGLSVSCCMCIIISMMYCTCIIISILYMYCSVLLFVHVHCTHVLVFKDVKIVDTIIE